MPPIVPHFQPKTKTQYALVMIVLLGGLGVCVYLMLFGGSGTDRDRIIQRAKTLKENKKPEEAVALLAQALAVEEKASGADSVKLVRYLDALSELHEEAGRHEQADPLIRRAIEIRSRVLG